MHTSVDSVSGSARHGSLYSQSELVHDQTFSGQLLGKDDAVIANLIAGVGNHFQGYGGRRRAGELSFAVVQSFEDPDEQPVYALEENEENVYVVLSLNSDAILVDHLLRPVTALTNENLDFLLASPDSVQLVRAFAAARLVPGWHGIGRMPKEDDVAIIAGSTFLLAANKTEEEALQTWMGDLAANGIGLRRSEGFGRISFGEPMHQAAFQRLKAGEENCL